MSAVHAALERVHKMLASDAGITPALAYCEIAPTLQTLAERTALSQLIDAELAAGRMRPAGRSAPMMNHGGLN